VPKFLTILGLVFALEATAQAQVKLDVSKITCDQFTGYKITFPQSIAIWLNGYFHGKVGETVLDVLDLNANAKQLEEYCTRNPRIPVMDAVETVLGLGTR
jgi:acid stress chaperone HdeB